MRWPADGVSPRWVALLCCIVLGVLSGCATTHRSAAVGEELAFVAARGKAVDLWMMRANGSSLVRLTSMPGTELEPSWSPDGSELVFVSSAARADPHGRLCILTLSTGQLRTVTPTSVNDAAMPTWSPDGKRIAYVREVDARDQVFTVNADGTGNRQITRDAATHDWPSWSPDSKHLAYTRSTGSGSSKIWVMTVDGSAAHSVQPPGVRTAYEEAWSPDGKSIAFVAPVGNPNAQNPVDWNEEVFVMTLDGMHVHRITHTPGNDHWPPAWSRDSRRLAYTADGVSGRSWIVVVQADGSRPITLRSPGLRAAAFPAW